MEYDKTINVEKSQDAPLFIKFIEQVIEKHKEKEEYLRAILFKRLTGDPEGFSWRPCYDQ